MVKFHYIKNNFHEARSTRIGASDIPKMLPDPENPVKSLAGYDNTAVTLYKQKVGLIEKDYTPSLAAEMGHFMENKVLELFIRMFDNKETGYDFRERKELFESKKNAIAKNYQVPPYHHNVQYYNDDMIVHPDMVYDGSYYNGIDDYKRTVAGVTVDFSKPFLVEAKSARLFSAKRPESSLVRGYDFDLNTWQGIPLKHYVQIQYQLALMEVDVAYLPLLYDTSNFQVWRVDANKKWQGRIMDIAGRMIKHIKNRTMPKELAMSKNDIIEIYPKVEKDYRMLVGGELEKMKDVCKEYVKADRQEKNWKAKKEDAKDAMAVYLKSTEELRDGSNVLARWETRKGSKKLAKGIGPLEKEDITTYKYLDRKGYIKTGSDSRFVKVKYKGE